MEGKFASFLFTPPLKNCNFVLSKERKFTKLDTDSVVGKVNAAKMVRSSAETKKEGVTSEEPADAWREKQKGILNKGFCGLMLWVGYLVVGMIQAWKIMEVMYIESSEYLHVARCHLSTNIYSLQNHQHM